MVKQGVDEKTIFLEPVYEREERGRPRADIQRWLRDSLFNEDVIADEIFQKYLVVYQSLTPEQRAALKVGITYSGSFNPYLRALEKYNMNIETIVNYGGQSLKGVFSGYQINNAHIKNVINIWGENDFYGKLVQEKKFTNVNVINIELKGADHSDFNIEDRYTGSRAELNRKAAQFNAYITKLATNPQVIAEVVLVRNGVTAVYQDGKIIKYEVDLSTFSIPEEQ
ncbi:MAG: hypothetical protein M1308_14725 [Actinobacteria bacterium]|nr:hypothetical protein [Actinomycetota bacterium]